MAFLYSIPSIVIEHQGIYRSIRRSFVVLKKNFLATSLLTFFPILIYFCMAFVRSNLPRLMKDSFPEISLLILMGSIFITFLINSLLVSMSTVLFLAYRKVEPALEGGAVREPE